MEVSEEAFGHNGGWTKIKTYGGDDQRTQRLWATLIVCHKSSNDAWSVRQTVYDEEVTKMPSVPPWFYNDCYFNQKLTYSFFNF